MLIFRGRRRDAVGTHRTFYPGIGCWYCEAGGTLMTSSRLDRKTGAYLVTGAKTST